MVSRTRITIGILALTALALLLCSQPVAAIDGVDGRIQENEYPHDVSLGSGQFRLLWDIQNDTIKMGMQAKVSGMVALGIDPVRRMNEADMIIGYRTGSEFQLHDAYSFGETGPHPDDVDEGGTYDIMEYMVTEIGGVTTIEFTRLLDTGDHLDKPIPADGKVKFIWATSSSDSFVDYHSRRGTATIDMETGKFEAIEYPTLWPFHAVFMSLAMIFFGATWFSVVYKKKLKKKFLMTHHNLGSAGVFCAIIGLGLGIYMVAQLGQGHIRITHAMVATADLVLGITTLAVGQVFLSYTKLKKRTRKPHIWLGGLSIFLMAVVVLLGLVYVYPV